MTALQAIKASMRTIGVLATGEAPTGDEGNDALATLNRMLDAWSQDDFLIPYETKESFDLISGQRTYTYGSGGDFDSARPISIQSAFLRDAGSTDHPLEIFSKDRWINKSFKATTSRPRGFFYSPEYPLAKIYFDTIPEDTDDFHVFALKPLTQIASLTTAFSLPPGYERAIILNLAVELNPEYGGKLDNVTLSNAVMAKKQLAQKTAASRMSELRMDDGIHSPRGGYDYLAGPA